MREENSRGNRTVGWFAGAKTIRKVADGNPRRFIQIMNALVERARTTALTPKNQQRVLIDYCERDHKSTDALPEYGRIVKETLDTIGKVLEAHVHGKYLVDGGCSFKLSSDLFSNKHFLQSLFLAIAYAYIHIDDSSLLEGVYPGTEYRLSYLYGIVFWLPMRKGYPMKIKSMGSSTSQPQLPLKSSKEAKYFMKQLSLGFESDEEKNRI